MDTQPAALEQLPRTQTKLNRLSPLILALIFVIIFASRVTRLPTMNMNTDEVWSVWQTLGSLQDTIKWTPYDWSPTYYLAVFGWQKLTGIDPFTLRVMTVLMMLVCAALIYRVAYKLCGRQAALYAMLVFSGLGYVLYLSTILRAYLLMVMVWLIALLLMMAYFERPRRSLAVLLGGVAALLFYIHTTMAFGIAMLVVFSFVMYCRPIRTGFRRWFTLWLLPGVITLLLCLPEIINKFHVIAMKGRAVQLYIPDRSPLALLANHYLDYPGQEPVLWACLFLIAAALILEHWHLIRRVVVLIVWMLAPVVLVWFTYEIDAFNTRHLAWVVIAFALWIGWGISLLPRPAKAALIIVMLLIMFDQIPTVPRYEVYPRPPVVTSFNTLRERIRSGDVIFIDPKCLACTPVAPEEWDYYSRAYFPQGLAFSTPEGHSRVWYVAALGHEDPTTLASLQSTRALTDAFGEDDLYFRLYETPPDPTGVLFENGMRLNGIEVFNSGGGTLVWHDGEPVKVRLWWSVDQPLKLDYSEGTYIVDPKTNAVTAQFDGPPKVYSAPSATSQWLPGRYYLEEREVTLPYPLDAGQQTLAMSVYQWWDSKRIGAPGETPDNLLVLKQLYIKAIRGSNLEQ